MELILGLVADAANKGEGGKLNVLGIFHDLQTPRLPCVNPHMALALEFRAKPYEKGKSFKIRVPLLDPDGQVLFQMDAMLHLSSKGESLEPVASLAINLHNVAFAKVGSHRFEVFVNDNRKGEILLNVSQPPKPGKGSAHGGP